MAIRVIVSDAELTGHPELVKAAISFGYGSDISSQIEIKDGGVTADWAYADSISAVMVVRSIEGIAGSITQALIYYPDILGFMPLGNNTYARYEPPTSMPVIVSSGANQLPQPIMFRLTIGHSIG